MFAAVPHRLTSEFQLLALPDPCLMAVIHWCAAKIWPDGVIDLYYDLHSLFAVAKCHSRLHQAAVLALRSIKASISTHVYTSVQQRTDSLLLYLARHGRHVDSLDLSGGSANFPGNFPQGLQLTSLLLDGFYLQLLPAVGQQGLLAQFGAATLRQVQLADCKLLDGPDGLAAALAQLPVLEHLSVRDTNCMQVDGNKCSWFATDELSVLQRLTYLELASSMWYGRDKLLLQPLQALTGLVELHLKAAWGADDISASMLLGMHNLTRLELPACSCEPDALGALTKLQHLVLFKSAALGEAGEVQLLSQLQYLQQLTYLQLWGQQRLKEQGDLHAAVYSNLTASNKLCHLGISGCTLPVGVWQHVFPLGRQLLCLTSLDVYSGELSGVSAPEGSRLVTCCPGLQRLDAACLQCTAELLCPLQGLSGLRTLLLGHSEWRLADNRRSAINLKPQGENGQPSKEVTALCQLTGLRELSLLCWHKMSSQELLQLSKLKQLTSLKCVHKEYANDKWRDWPVGHFLSYGGKLLELIGSEVGSRLKHV